MWLKREPEQVLSKNSVSTATLDVAFEEREVLTTAKLKELQDKQDIINCKFGEMLNAVIPLSKVSSVAASTSASTPKARRVTFKKKTTEPPPPPPPTETPQAERDRLANLRVTRPADDGDERTVTRIRTHPSLSAEELSDVSDTEIRDEASLVASTASKAIPLVRHRTYTRELAVEDIDAPIAKYPAMISLKGVTSFSVELEARRQLVAQRLSEMPLAAGPNLYLTEHVHSSSNT